MTSLDRSAHAVLVPMAQSNASIAVIRSLGRAGYPVHAIASDPNALGLRSRYASERTVHPAISSPDFAVWFPNYIRRHRIEMIMPGWSFEPIFHDYAQLFPMTTDPGVLAAAQSKTILFERLLEGEENRANLPGLLLVDFDRPLPTQRELEALPAPLFIKLDGALGRQRESDGVVRVHDAAEARSQLEALAGRYHRAMVQGYVPGRGAGAFLLRWRGRTIARMMHLRLHETPHTGGASSLRRTWWHEAMMRDSEVKLAHLGWEGVAMVEYRWDNATDRFYLMEMNLRFWGSLHLALYAGVDFPALLADAFLLNQTPDNVVEGRQGITCRNTIPFEIAYLVSLWRDSNVSLSRKAYAGLEAIKLTADPRVREDLLYPGDRGLFFERLKDVITGKYKV